MLHPYGKCPLRCEKVAGNTIFFLCYFQYNNTVLKIHSLVIIIRVIRLPKLILRAGVSKLNR